MIAYFSIRVKSSIANPLTMLTHVLGQNVQALLVQPNNLLTVWYACLVEMVSGLYSCFVKWNTFGCAFEIEKNAVRSFVVSTGLE